MANWQLSSVVLSGLVLGTLCAVGCASAAKSNPPAVAPTSRAESMPSAAATATAGCETALAPRPEAGFERRNAVADHLSMKLLKPLGWSPAYATEGGASAAVVPASAEPLPFVFAARRASEARDHLAALIEIRHEKRGDVMTLLCDKLVEPGQWAITDSGQFRVKELAPALRDQDGHAILIQGYTDSLGTAAVNDALSLRRAEAVRDYFIAQGVPAGNMRAEGLGARRPVAANSTPEGRAPKSPDRDRDRALARRPMAREEVPGQARPKAPPLGWQNLAALGVLLAAMYAWQAYSSHRDAHPTISYTAFYALVEGAKVETLTIRGQSAGGRLKTPETVEGQLVANFRTMIPAATEPDLFPSLRKQGVKVVVESEEQPPAVQILISVLPWVLIIGAWFLISRNAQKMMSRGGPFGGLLKQRSHRIEKEGSVKVTFDDVAGLKAAKQDLREVVDFLREPARFQRLGGKVPRGILLVGSPGTGKTLLARAVAGESGVPFFSMGGSEFIELFVGMGASRVRELFAEARKVAPAIIFIDEIDAVGRSRGTGLGGGHDEREQTLNQLLSEMDGFSRNDLTIVLAATNRPDVLDSALLRPGRFDRRVIVDRPECAARRSILEVHAKGKPIGQDVSLEEVAQGTPGFSGADLANLVNEAALNATRRGATAIESIDFASAEDKIILGDARETRLDRVEKRRVAIHESGHAVVAYFTPDTEPLRRVTVIPRGMALGATQQTPSEDRHIASQPELEARLRVLMGGYAAEILLYGQPSSGAENDLRQGTEIAYRMVAQFGMSEKLGPVFYEHRVEHPFLGQRLATDSGISDRTVHTIEEETRKLLASAFRDATTLIGAHRPRFDDLVELLLVQETVERGDLEKTLGSKNPTVALA